MTENLDTLFHYTGSISDDERQFYSKYGFLHYSGFFPADIVTRLNVAVDKACDAVFTSGKKSVNGIPVRFGQNEDGITIVQRLPFTSACNNEVERLLMDSGIGAFTDLITDEATRLGFNERDGVVTNCYINGPGSAYRQMGWHTDGLREMRPFGKVQPMINMGIYLTHSNNDNGGLRILPGTHRQGLMGMLFRKLFLLDKTADKKEFLIEARAGDLVLHDGRLWHRVGLSPHTGALSYRRGHVPAHHLRCSGPAASGPHTIIPPGEQVYKL